MFHFFANNIQENLTILVFRDLTVGAQPCTDAAWNKDNFVLVPTDLMAKLDFKLVTMSDTAYKGNVRIARTNAYFELCLALRDAFTRLFRQTFVRHAESKRRNKQKGVRAAPRSWCAC
jgi:hypothetical protein